MLTGASRWGRISKRKEVVDMDCCQGMLLKVKVRRLSGVRIVAAIVWRR